MGDDKDAKRGSGSSTPLAPTPLKVEITSAKGKDKTKYAIAVMPRPRADPAPWSAKVNSKDEIPATFKFSREGKEAGVAWGTGSPPKIVFKNGTLNVTVELVDGPDASPKASEKSGVVTVSSVQQGDVVIIEENRTKGRDQVAVAKNFTWNDFKPRTSTLKLAPDFASLPESLKKNVMETIKFVLDPGQLQCRRNSGRPSKTRLQGCILPRSSPPWRFRRLFALACILTTPLIFTLLWGNTPML